MGKKVPDHEGWPTGEHARGGRGGSKSNDSRGGEPRGNNGPRMKQAVTMAEVKKRAEERDKK